MEQLTASDTPPPPPWAMIKNVNIPTKEEVNAWLDQVLAGTAPIISGEAAPQPPLVQLLSLPDYAGISPNKTLKNAYALKEKATALIQKYGKKPTISPATEAEYRKKMKTIGKWHSDPLKPPDIEAHAATKNSFYAYRAALIWDAIQRLKESRRRLDNSPSGSPGWKEAFVKLQIALRDLDAYPMDRNGSKVQAYRQQKALHGFGLSDGPEASAFTQAKRAGKTKAPSKDKGKAWYAGNLNLNLPNWRQTIFTRLTKIDSPWLLHAAVASLTGCRPEELEGIRITLESDGRLRFVIKGAKVSAQKGQPIRTLTLHEDSPEFTVLKEHCVAHKEEGMAFALKTHIPLDRHGNSAPLANPAEAFGAAVKRAGNQALGKKYHFSAYCYRHALASDLKADGMDREDLAMVLGHAVTETASCYGRFSGGRKNVRQIEAEGTRVVKVNHKAGPEEKRPSHPSSQRSPI